MIYICIFIITYLSSVSIGFYVFSPVWLSHFISWRYFYFIFSVSITSFYFLWVIHIVKIMLCFNVLMFWVIAAPPLLPPQVIIEILSGLVPLAFILLFFIHKCSSIYILFSFSFSFYLFINVGFITQSNSSSPYMEYSVLFSFIKIIAYDYFFYLLYFFFKI